MAFGVSAVRIDEGIAKITKKKEKRVVVMTIVESASEKGSGAE